MTFQALSDVGFVFMLQVPLVKNASKAGLGSDSVDLSELEVDPNVGKKRALWQKTQQRYYEIPE